MKFILRYEAEKLPLSDASSFLGALSIISKGLIIASEGGGEEVLRRVRLPMPYRLRWWSRARFPSPTDLGLLGEAVLRGASWPDLDGIGVDAVTQGLIDARVAPEPVLVSLQQGSLTGVIRELIDKIRGRMMRLLSKSSHLRRDRERSVYEREAVDAIQEVGGSEPSKKVGAGIVVIGTYQLTRVVESLSVTEVTVEEDERGRTRGGKG